MTRDEMRSYTKEWFGVRGYKSRKSCLYKIIDDDYLIGMCLEASGYSKSYMFTCGVIYLPDDIKMPIRGIFDYQLDFLFPQEPEQKFMLVDAIQQRKFTKYFEYGEYGIAQLDDFLNQNYEHFLARFLDKEYVLERFRSDWRLMGRFSVQNIKKLCARAGLDELEVLSFLKKK